VRVQSADGATIIGTPALGRGVAAFFASTSVTTSRQFDITVEADVLNQVAETSETNNVVTYAFGEGANSTGRWRPIGPYAMAKVFTAPGSVTSIIRDGSRQATYFVSVATPLNIGGGRIYEINPEAPLRFKGQDITANLPATLVGQVGAWVRWVELGRWGG
jgi:hypothetical protein